MGVFRQSRKDPVRRKPSDAHGSGRGKGFSFPSSHQTRTVNAADHQGMPGG
jgi:hypothetical protein